MTTISGLFRQEMSKVFNELEALETSTSGPDGDEYPLAISQTVLDHFDRLLDIMVSLKIITFDEQMATLVKSYTSNPVRFFAATNGVINLKTPFFEINDWVEVMFLSLKGRIVWVDNIEGEADLEVKPSNEIPYILRRVNTLLLSKQ